MAGLNEMQNGQHSVVAKGSLSLSLFLPEEVYIYPDVCRRRRLEEMFAPRNGVIFELGMTAGIGWRALHEILTHAKSV